MKVNTDTTISIKRALNSGAALAVLLLFFVTTHGQTVHTQNVQIGLFYPISSNGTRAAADTNIFSFNVIAGLSREEKAFSFAGVTNVIRDNASGMQFAGFSNHLGGSSEGMLFAGFVNTYAQGKGMQFAGFSNVAKGQVFGGQFAGFFNRAADVTGFQFAGFSNVAGKVEGSQFAGFINTSKAITGSQFAGFANITRSESHGSQFAGFINTAGDIKGSQFAGFINIAKKVKGSQIAGFINIADSSDYPVGIINIIKKGEKSIGVSVDDNASTLLTFRSGGKGLYGIIGAGYNFNNSNHELYALEAGFGAHFNISSLFRTNTELTTLALQTFNGGEYFKSSFRLLPAFKLGRSVEIYGGPAFNWVNTNTVEGRNLTENYLSEWINSNGYFRAIYIGYMGGLNFLF